MGTGHEDYVSQFAFQKSEVVKDSFEIFINTEKYRKGADECRLVKLVDAPRSADPDWSA